MDDIEQVTSVADRLDRDRLDSLIAFAQQLLDEQREQERAGA